MDRLPVLLTILGLAAAHSVSTAAAATLDDRPTLAIVEFEITPAGTVLPPSQLGVTLADLMLDKLVASDRFRVVDGRWLETTTGGGGRSAFDTFRANAAAAGVDYVVLGSVTRFSTEQRRRGLGAAALLVPLVGGYRRNKTELTLAVTLRIVDVRTGEVATTVSAQGGSGRKNVTLGGLARGGIGGAFVNAASGFRDSLLDEAMQHLVTTAATGLVNAAPKLGRGGEEFRLSRLKLLHLRPDRRFNWHARLEVAPPRLQSTLTRIPRAIAAARSGVQMLDDPVGNA